MNEPAPVTPTASAPARKPAAPTRGGARTQGAGAATSAGGRVYQSGKVPRPAAVSGGAGGAAGSGDQAVLSWEGYLAGWSRLHGGHDVRRAFPLVRYWLRLGYQVARLLARTWLRPNTVTGLGLVLAVAVPVVTSWQGGWPVVAGVLVVATAFADTVDGALAIITRRATRFGYVYDALADRLGEVGWLVAFAALGARYWMVGLCGATMWLHEYVRAQTAAAGAADPGVFGLGDQSTRAGIVAVALVFAGAGGLVSPALSVGTVTVAGAIWAMVQAIGFLQLLAGAHRALR